MKVTKTLLLINLFFLQSYLIRFSFGPYPTNLQEVLIFILIVTFLIDIIRRKKLLQVIKNIKNHWIILTFILLTILSIIVVPIYQKTDFIRHLKFLFFGVVFVFIFLETFTTNNSRKNAIKMAGLGAIVFGLFSIIYNILGYNVAHDLRLLGPLDAAVYLAYYMTPFFLFFIIEFAKNSKNKSNLIYGLILGLLILSTRSMGAIGGSFLVLVIYFLKIHINQIRRNKILKIILILSTILIITVIFFSKILPTIKTQYSSLDERGEIWKTSIYLLKEPKNLLFGVGFGQFEHQYILNAENVLKHPPLDLYVIQPHNIFLLFTFHYGIFGLFFLLFIIFKTIKSLLPKIKDTDIQKISTFILLYFFIHGLIDTPFYKNDIMILFILFLEISLTSIRKQAPLKLNRDPRI